MRSGCFKVHFMTKHKNNTARLRGDMGAITMKILE